MRRILLTFLKVALSAGLLYLALRKTDFVALGQRLTWASIGWILLALAVCLVQVVISAARWHLVSVACDAPIPTRQAARYNLIGSFFNQTLPSSIGGDAVRLWLLARTGVGWRAATYSIFIDRAIGLIALAVLIVASLPWSYGLIADPAGRTALLIVDALALGAGMGFLIIGWLPWSFLKTWWVTHHIHACSVIASRLIFSPSKGPAIAVLSALIHVTAIVVAWCVIRAIEAPVSFGQIFQLIPPVVLITMLPISMAGWGLREATMGLAFGYAGLAAHEGVNVSLLYGGVYFIIGVIGGLVWIVSAEKAAKGASPIEVPDEVAAVQ
ncbi:MAG: hypothetical protein JWR73_2218 [Tardiphaga sp.]|nr:hypothetical protein [Tardiphaga sp.]MDB5547879.1 hypothetical protein [Tardiphaga sp.]MDB5573972.1 hypothetical protein [Tardiphaga sp.]MDB5626416.1 hypothetical protein [Tardiphaga sp.]MDB5627776.1 hypothetical protein [Tardiphaga sp.]